MKQIIINNIPIELEKKRIKNMYLKILPPEGKVHISAPLRMSEEEIRHFVLTKLDWIEGIQKKLKTVQTPQETNYCEGEEIYYRGRKYYLSVVETSNRPVISIIGDRINLFIHSESTAEQKKKVIDTWYRDSLRKMIPPLIEQWESIIGVKADGFSIRDMKTRWGTCNVRSRNICLNLQLAKKPEYCLEYVIVHELVHLLEKSHNRIFKGYMDKFLPGWRSIKKELNGTGIS